MYLANWKFNGAKVMYIWEINDACPGHFLSIYKPLINVTFITRKEADVLKNLDYVVRYHNSRHNVEYYANHFKIPVFYDIVLFQGISQLKLLDSINTKIYNYVVNNDICNALGIHIRRTDLHDELPKLKQMTYESTFWFISTYAKENITLFLATDNADTQKIFIDYYGLNQTKVTKLLIYNLIDGEKNKKIIASGKVSKEFRHTDLETAVIEMYILTYVKFFRMSLYSSYSGWVEWIRLKWRKNIPICLNEKNPIVS